MKIEITDTPEHLWKVAPPKFINGEWIEIAVVQLKTGGFAILQRKAKFIH